MLSDPCDVIIQFHYSVSMKRIIPKIFGLCFFCSVTVFAQQQQQESEWHGFVRESFLFQGRKAQVVKPDHTLQGNPWVWRAYFPDWHIEMDSILLRRGFHIAYIDCSDMYGNAESMQVWDNFYDYLTNEKQLSKKPALEGVSRGGLFIYGWAKRNPDKVSCIYAEAPVMNITQWAEKAKEIGEKKEALTKLLKAYQFSVDQLNDYKDNPIENLEGLAGFKIPVVHVVCEKDSVVPVMNNTRIFEANYKKLGGNVQVDYMTEEITFNGHHFRINDPGHYADFIMQNSWPVKQNLENKKFIHEFGSLNNCLLKLNKEKALTVAFMGGSITQGRGWRGKVMQYLNELYPQVNFHFIQAGIASLGSVPHAFRLQRDVLDSGKIDVLFLEAAVNDWANNTPEVQQKRAMEGIVRHALTNNPYMNVIIMAFADESKVEDYQQGRIPKEVKVHEDISSLYHLPFMNLAREVEQRIAHREFTWKEDFKDLHPSPFGQEIYFQTIKTLWRNAIKKYEGQALSAAVLPPVETEGVYDRGKYESVDKAVRLKQFSVIPDWQPGDGKPVRPGFVNVPVLAGEEAGASFTFRFRGNAVGIATVSGPDAGMIRYKIDGKASKTVDLYTQWSKSLHLPWYLVLGDNLTDKKHKVEIEILAQKNKLSLGNACRIVHFLVNE